MCSCDPRTLGPQKKTPASVGLWIDLIPLKIWSQLGRPKFVGARSPVMASFSAFASLIIIFVASSGLIFAVKYYITDIVNNPS